MFLFTVMKNAIEMMITDRNAVQGELFNLLQEFISLFSDVDALTSHEIQLKVLVILHGSGYDFKWQ